MFEKGPLQDPARTFSIFVSGAKKAVFSWLSRSMDFYFFLCSSKVLRNNPKSVPIESSSTIPASPVISLKLVSFNE